MSRSGAGQALEQHHEQNHEQGAARGLEVLAVIAEQLNRYGALEEILEASARLTCELLGATGAWVFVREDDDSFTLAASHGLPSSLERNGREALRWGPCRCQRAALDDELPCAVNVVTCERIARSLLHRGPARAHGSVPLWAGTELVGILNLILRDTRPLQEDELQLLAIVGQTIGMALQRARFSEQQLVAAHGASERRYRALAQHASDIVLIVDLGGSITYASPAVSHVLGHPLDELDGERRDLLHPDDLRSTTAAVGAIAEVAGASTRFGARLRHADGSWLHFEVVATNLLDDPDIGGFVFNARDVTDRVRFEEQLARLSVQDHLTGLPNRVLLRDRLEQALGRVTAASGVAVLLADLDGFKVVNDSLGHAAGDELLVAVADRLRDVVRHGDTLARLGGDEFVLVCGNVTDERAALARAEEVQRSLHASFPLAGNDAKVTASIGVALAFGDDATTEELLRDADVAMYRAKEQGRSRSELFSREQRARALERMEMEQALRQALDGDELRLLFQPAVALADGAPSSLEALVAWQHPTRGLLRAGSFIPLAEDTGLIIPLSEWVLAEACGFATSLAEQRPHGPRIPVAVNLSVHQLAVPDLVDTVTRILDETGTDPSLLALEITESGLTADLDGAVEQLRRLRALGIRLIVDDFGTGYSSLVRLRQFPVDALKIDQSFVAGLGRVDEDTAIVRSVIDLAHALGLGVIAEGVETPEQCAILGALGCRFAQGFLWSEGLPRGELLEWMDRVSQSSIGLSTVTM